MMSFGPSPPVATTECEDQRSMAAEVDTPAVEGGRPRSNLTWLVSGRAMQLGLAFVVGVLVTRYLGPDDLGVLSLAQAWAGLFTPLALVGSQLIVRDLAREQHESDRILGSGAALAGLVGWVAYAISTVSAALFMHTEGSVLLVAILGAPLLVAPLNSLSYWFEATLQAKYITIARGAALVLGLSARIVVIITGGGILALAIIITVENMLGVVALLWWYRRGSRGVRAWRPDRRRVRSLLDEAFPLLVASVAIAVYMRIDQVMLGALSTSRETGLYAAVVKLSEAPYFISTAIAASFAPGIARMHANDKPAYDKQVSRMFTIQSAAALSFAIPVAVLSVPIVTVLLGHEFDGAGPVLAVHVASAPFVFLGVGQSVWTTNESLQTLAMVRTVSGAVLNVLLNFVLIPPFGALGASFATLIAYAWSTCFANVVSAKTRHVLWLQLGSLDPRRLYAVGRAELRTLRR